MKANEVKLLKFLNGPRQFTIPIYQRTYSWTKKQCEQLFKDVLKAGADDKVEGYFIGSIVYIDKGIYQVSAVPQLHVIDGQQRLTTLSLLLKALSKKLKDHGPIEDINDKKLVNYYLLNNEETGNLRHKLILTQNDQETLFNILEDRELPANPSKRVADNYHDFVEMLEDVDIAQIYKGISKLIVIDVSLDRGKDNPQLIFESLNSTGLELSQADLIRNFILMGLEPKEQTDLYTDYWYRMEQNFGHAEYSEKFDRFMRDYLTIKTKDIPNINEVYDAFKVFSKEFSSVKELVADIYKYSKYFVNIEFEKETDSDLREIITNINALKVNVSYPFIMNVYRDYEDKIIEKNDFVAILKFIESYVFRRAICGIPTNSLNKTFANLYREIQADNYLESFIAAMRLKDSYRRFPLDDEFMREIRVKDVYNFRNRNYLLGKLENHDRKELVNVESFTIEHVMPQNENLSVAWQTDLGKDWQNIQKKHLHTIGNLTLTGYNSELSDKPFKDKRDMKGGFKDSPIRLNRDLAVLEHWNEREIQTRALNLSEAAVTVWECPVIELMVLMKYSKAEETKGGEKYDLSHYEKITGDNTILFEELNKRILNFGTDVTREYLKIYIAFKTSTNFADFIPKKNGFDVFLNMPFSNVKDTKGICEDVSGRGHWANGDVKFKLESRKDLDYAISLVKQAYDIITGAENV